MGQLAGDHFLTVVSGREALPARRDPDPVLGRVRAGASIAAAAPARILGPRRRLRAGSMPTSLAS